MKYQVAIIGGGPAGYTAAETAGKAGLSVVLFEKRNLGGVCLNEGVFLPRLYCTLQKRMTMHATHPNTRLACRKFRLICPRL